MKNASSGAGGRKKNSKKRIFSDGVKMLQKVASLRVERTIHAIHHPFQHPPEVQHSIRVTLMTLKVKVAHEA